MREGLRQVLLAIASTRQELDGPRGPRRYPDHTAWEGSERAVERLSERRRRRERERRLGWADLLLEAAAVAVAAPANSVELERRLLRLGALVTAWLEDLHARRMALERAAAPPPPGTVLHVRVPPRSLVYRATIQRDGRVFVSALNRSFSLDELTVQRVEADEPAPDTAADPLRASVSAELEAIRRRQAEAESSDEK